MKSWQFVDRSTQVFRLAIESIYLQCQLQDAIFTDAQVYIGEYKDDLRMTDMLIKT